MSASRYRWTVRAAQLGLTVLATYFLFRSLRLSWDQLAGLDPAAWRPRPGVFLASVAALLAVFVYLVTLWARMVRSFGGPALGLHESVAIFFLANLGRYIPGKVWQMLGLAYLAARRGVSVPVSSAAAVLGQLFSLGAAAIVAAAAIALARSAGGPAGGGGAGLPKQMAPWALALAAGIALVIVMPAALRLGLRIAFRLSRRPGAPPALDPWFGVRWLALYVPAWIGYGLAFGLLWSAFPALGRVVWSAAVGGFAGAYFLGYAALFAPAGIGVREGAMAVLLAPWLGAPQAAVLAVAARLWMSAAELLPLAAVGLSRTLRRLHAN